MSPTRREFLYASAAAAALGTLGRPALLSGWAAQQAPPVFTPLRRNVGTFTMRGGTVGWLLNPDAVVVVDSQFPAEAEALIVGLSERSRGRGVDYLVNTHHHGDHTAGNVAFRGVAKNVVAHAQAAEHMRRPPGGNPPEDQLFPATTFTEEWAVDAGDERVRAHYHGRAHTSGDAVVTFERANVVHMGDLMFHRRHPVVDRAAGATLRNWMTVLDRAIADHDGDTIYIFGHANSGLPITGGRSDLEHFRDYMGALLEFVGGQIRAGRSRAEIMAMRDALAGFEAFGPFGQEGPRDPLTCAYEELSAEG